MTTNIATPHVEVTTDSPMQVRDARQGLLVFACFLIPLSLFGYWFHVAHNDLPLNIPILPMMFAPGLASIITRLLRHEGFADVSFRIRNARMGSVILFSFGFALVVGLIAYGFAFLSGLAKFDPPAFLVDGPPLVRFAGDLALAGTLGFLLSFITSTGEEVGWRGYLLLRMIQARIPQPIFLTSLIWGAWHLPIVFAGVYAKSSSLWISVTGLMITALAVGAILAWLRLRTGSVWVPIFMHAAWNGLINAGFTLAVQNHTENIWVGETGILVIMTIVIAAILLRRAWKPIPLVDG